MGSRTGCVMPYGGKSYGVSKMPSRRPYGAREEGHKGQGHMMNAEQSRMVDTGGQTRPYGGYQRVKTRPYGVISESYIVCGGCMVWDWFKQYCTGEIGC